MQPLAQSLWLFTLPRFVLQYYYLIIMMITFVFYINVIFKDIWELYSQISWCKLLLQQIEMMKNEIGKQPAD